LLLVDLLRSAGRNVSFIESIRSNLGSRELLTNSFAQRKGTHMGIISWIILGLIAGFIGSKIVNRQGQGFWLDIALGIVGALVGGFLFSTFGATGVTGLNIWSMIVAIVGSIVVLLIYNAVMGGRRV
jgi:uncharacterized membrane protein YeaQ/YmgE (transglycosylase-associated protein family)